MREQKRTTFEKKGKRGRRSSPDQVVPGPAVERPAEKPPIFLRNFDPRTRFNFEWHPPEQHLTPGEDTGGSK
jgi:hypothetical protein